MRLLKGMAQKLHITLFIFMKKNTRLIFAKHLRTISASLEKQGLKFSI